MQMFFKVFKPVAFPDFLELRGVDLRRVFSSEGVQISTHLPPGYATVPNLFILLLEFSIDTCMEYFRLVDNFTKNFLMSFKRYLN